MVTGSLAAWLWLVEVQHDGRALDASDTQGDLAAALSGHFAKVEVLRAEPTALEEIRSRAEREGWPISELTLGSLASAPWREARFDCIALQDTLLRAGAGTADLTARLVRVRQLLLPGGWLALSSFNPHFLGRRNARQPGISPARLARECSQAGFVELRTLFAEPSAEDPRTLLPDARAAVLAFETCHTLRGASGPARRLAARWGIRSLLYPAYFILARA